MQIMDMTALELGRKIKEKEVSVKEAVQASLDTIEAKDEALHSFVTVDAERALARADEVQKGIEDGTYTGPLAGVPAAVKDNICTENLLTTCSSKILYNFVPPYSAQAVCNLNAAGGVILGKTNMDEFAMGSTTETSAYGVTRNPWNLEHVPGGSSGGSCAAVAACEAPYALGSDTGGSIPAAWILLWCHRPEADLRHRFPVWTDRLWIFPGPDRTDRKGYFRLCGDSGNARIL